MRFPFHVGQSCGSFLALIIQGIQVLNQLKDPSWARAQYMELVSSVIGVGKKIKVAEEDRTLNSL